MRSAKFTQRFLIAGHFLNSLVVTTEENDKNTDHPIGFFLKKGNRVFCDTSQHGSRSFFIVHAHRAS